MKSVLVAATHTTKTPKRVSKKKVVVLEEAPVQIIPIMRGKIPKVSLETHSTSPKQSNEEYPIQVIPDDSPNQLEILDIPQNVDEEFKVGMNESQNDPQVGQHDIPLLKEEEDPITYQLAYSKTALVSYK